MRHHLFFFTSLCNEMKRKRNKFFTEQTEKRNVLDKAECVVPGGHDNIKLFITLVTSEDG